MGPYDEPSISSGSSVTHFPAVLSNLTADRLDGERWRVGATGAKAETEPRAAAATATRSSEKAIVVWTGIMNEIIRIVMNIHLVSAGRGLADLEL